MVMLHFFEDSVEVGCEPCTVTLEACPPLLLSEQDALRVRILVPGPRSCILIHVAASRSRFTFAAAPTAFISAFLHRFFVLPFGIARPNAQILPSFLLCWPINEQKPRHLDQRKKCPPSLNTTKIFDSTTRSSLFFIDMASNTARWLTRRAYLRCCRQTGSP